MNISQNLKPKLQCTVDPPGIHTISWSTGSDWATYLCLRSLNTRKDIVWCTDLRPGQLQHSHKKARRHRDMALEKNAPNVTARKENKKDCFKGKIIKVISYQRNQKTANLYSHVMRREKFEHLNKKITEEIEQWVHKCWRQQKGTRCWRLWSSMPQSNVFQNS